MQKPVRIELRISGVRGGGIFGVTPVLLDALQRVGFDSNRDQLDMRGIDEGSEIIATGRRIDPIVFTAAWKEELYAELDAVMPKIRLAVRVTDLQKES